MPPRYSKCPGRGFADRVFCQCLARLKKIERLSALRASGCPRTTMSSPVSASACWRNDSRTSRFKRFLSQALRQCFLDIASPSLAWSMPLFLAKTVNKLSRLLLALANTWLNASAPGKRLALVNRRSRAATDPELMLDRLAVGLCSSRLVLSDAFVFVEYCGLIQANRYGVSCARPLARRRLSTRRPAFVAMRARNPWVLARFKLPGWNVRFIVFDLCLKTPASSSERKFCWGCAASVSPLGKVGGKGTCGGNSCQPSGFSGSELRLAIAPWPLHSVDLRQAVLVCRPEGSLRVRHTT